MLDNRGISKRRMRCGKTAAGSALLVCFLILLSTLVLTTGGEAQTRMELRVDLTDAPRHLLHVTEKLQAHAGVNTFCYPQWIPGQHLPAGPIDNLTGLVFRAGSETGPVLAWRRDLVDLYSFHVVAPANVSELVVAYDVLDVPSRANTTATRRTSRHVVMLEPSDIVLYPAGIAAREITVEATIQLPEHWKAASALNRAGNAGATLFGSGTTFTSVSLEQFVDSPILAGDHCRQFALAPEIRPRHTLDVCAEKDTALDLPAAMLEPMNALVRQTTRLFRSHHYDHYDFLVALSPHLDGDSLEHAQSADYVVKGADLTEAGTLDFIAYLIPHENTHSWCGKYRRPARMATPDYQTVQQDDLLWVYEGLTEYYGGVLASRAGFRTAAQGVSWLDFAVYNIDQPGRQWRPLQDTADAAPILRGTNAAWANWRRDQDYYREGALLWLEADMKIRTLTGGKKSLDDFAALFLGATPAGGPGDTGPGVLPYEFGDVVQALNRVAPYDWATFWTERLNSLDPKAPTAGLAQAGYAYIESETMSEAEAGFIKPAHLSDMLHSLGLFVLPDGTLRDVWMHSPAYQAGLGPGDKLTAVNGETYTPEALAKAVDEAKDKPGPIGLTIVRDDESSTLLVNYHGGEKYPVLQPNDRPDVLTTRIFAPAD